MLFPASHYVTADERMKTRHRRHRGRAASSGWRGSRSTASCSRRSACACAPPTTSRCCARSGCAPGIENYSLPPRRPRRRARCRTRCSTTSPTTTSSCSTSRTRRSRSSTGSTRATSRARTTLVEHGFRLPSAMDNRPLRFEEFIEQGQPGGVPVGDARQLRDRAVRRRWSSRSCGPTGLIDPEIDREAHQGPDRRPRRRDPASAPTPTSACSSPRSPRRWRKTSPSTCSSSASACATCTARSTRSSASRSCASLRLGEFDVLVGINLLREGLDLPEVSLVAILDADKEGFLRSQTSLIQTIGRAARNVDGQVIMYADQMTDSMRYAISETNRRRKKQLEYNERARHRPADRAQEGHRHPRDAARLRRRRRRQSRGSGPGPRPSAAAVGGRSTSPTCRPTSSAGSSRRFRTRCTTPPRDLRFEEAARLRDEINELKRELRAAV